MSKSFPVKNDNSGLDREKELSMWKPWRILSFTLKPMGKFHRLLPKNVSPFLFSLLPPFRMRIVDDDVSWTSISTTKPEKEEEEDDGDLPVVCIFWGCKNFEIQAFQPQLPMWGTFVIGEVGQRILPKKSYLLFYGRAQQTENGN